MSDLTDFIFDSVRKYKRFEEYIASKIKYEFNDEKETYKGFLIDKEFIDNWKKFTYYENIKGLITYLKYEDSKNIINLYQNKVVLPKVNFLKGNPVPFSFSSAIRLYKNIKSEGKEYVLVDHKFLKSLLDSGLFNPKIFKHAKEKELEYCFNKEGKLIINSYKNDNIRRLPYYIASKLIIRAKHNYITKDLSMEIIDEDYDPLYFEEFKKLLLLYAYEQEMKIKINNLKYRNRWQDYYLVSTEWINEYKKFFHFNELSHIIIGNEELRKVLNNGYINAKNQIEIAIKLIKLEFKKSPNEFPENLKFSNTFLCEGSKINLSSNSEIIYLKNFEIINEDLKKLLSKSDYYSYDLFAPNNFPYPNNNQDATKSKGLICGGKIILDIGENINPGKNVLEIGGIGNKDMTFIEEYIFYYDSEEDKKNHYDYFKDKFYSFQKDELKFGMNLESDLVNEEGEAVGIAYKIPLQS